MTQRFSRSCGAHAAIGFEELPRVNISTGLKTLVGHPIAENRSLRWFQSPAIACNPWRGTDRSGDGGQWYKTWGLRKGWVVSEGFGDQRARERKRDRERKWVAFEKSFPGKYGIVNGVKFCVIGKKIPIWLINSQTIRRSYIRLKILTVSPEFAISGKSFVL